MMKNYDDYGLFLITAIQKVVLNNNIQNQDRKTIEDTVKILKKGWDAFMSTTSILDKEGPGFLSALACYCISPIGMKMGSLGITDSILLHLNRHSSFPDVVKDIGIRYKNKFDRHVGEKKYIDALLDEVTTELVRKISITESNK